MVAMTSPGPSTRHGSCTKSWSDSQLVVLDDAGHDGGSFPNELVGALDSWLIVGVSRAALAPRRLRPTGFASTHRARRADRREHGRQFARSKRGSAAPACQPVASMLLNFGVRS
jgi:hypothetical protein